MIKNDINLDIFISHTWRFHEEWKMLVDILDEVKILTWRNFSVPWHDPALRPTNEIGINSITETLKGQIIPCHICFFITDLFLQKSNIRWLDMSLEFAKEYKVPYYYTGIKNIEEFKNLDNFVNFEINEIENLLVELPH